MNTETQKTLEQLTQLCTLCDNHRFNEDSYTAPGFVDFLDRPLNIDDIPMESYNTESNVELAKDPKTIPWEDSIKNFVMDLISVDATKKFSTCILLTEFAYAYSSATRELVARIYGSSTTAIISIAPLDDRAHDFIVTIERDNKVEYQVTLEREYIVSHAIIWYVPNSSLVLCHSSCIPEYREILGMMPEATWSISCTCSSFVKSANVYETCRYICPVYSYPGSMETRAVGNGKVKFSEDKVVKGYVGRMNYYFRCIRGSKHSSGRCYDCTILHRLLAKLGAVSSIGKDHCNVIFDSQFLLSAGSEEVMSQ